MTGVTGCAQKEESEGCVCVQLFLAPPVAWANSIWINVCVSVCVCVVSCVFLFALLNFCVEKCCLCACVCVEHFAPFTVKNFHKLINTR